MWIIGASVMTLTPPVTGDDSVKQLAKIMAARQEELRWARRCLFAIICASVLLGSVVAVSFLVGA